MSDSRIPVNDLPRPRILIRCTPGTLEALQKEKYDFPGSVKIIDYFGEVDLSEWDCLITDQPFARLAQSPIGRYVTRDLPDEICVFFVLTTSNGALQVDGMNYGSGQSGAIAIRTSVAGHRLFIRDDIGEAHKRLIRDTILPSATRRSRHFGIQPNLPLLDDGALRMLPFLEGPQDIAIAGIYTRLEVVNFFVPNYVSELAPWLDLAFDGWSKINPTAFPVPPHWPHSAAWLLPVEHEVSDQASSLREELESETARLNALISEAEVSLELLRGQVDASERRLLTSQGDELAEAVMDALIRLGFDVENMDLKWADGAKREDLRIRDQARPGWIALGEVTGSKKGVPQLKAMKVQQHVASYMAEASTFDKPAAWLLVNQFMEQEPSQRHEVFRPDIHDSLAEGGFLTIETVALFVLLRAVLSGLVNEESVRSLLVAKRGLLDRADAEAWVESEADSTDLESS